MSWSPKTFVADEETNKKDEWTPKSFEADDESEGKTSTVGDILGTAASTVGYGLGDIINTPVEAANYANKKLAGLFGVKPENVPTPEPFDPDILAKAFVSKERAKQLAPLGRTISTAAELAVPALDIAKLAGTGIKALTGFNANEKATNFMKSLIGNQKNIQSVFREDYGKLGKLAEDKGYNSSKPIDADSFSTRLNAMDDDDKKSFLKNLSPDAKEKLTKFGNEPTYENAHDLQSILGREGIGLTKNRETAMMGRMVLNTRDALNQDITNNFLANGDQDLAAMRQDVSQRYAQNENKLLLANKLKSGAEDLPIGGLSADASQIVSNYGKERLKSLFGRPGAPLINPERDQIIADIQKSLGRQDVARKIERVARWPIGAAIGGAIGIPAYHYIRELL